MTDEKRSTRTRALAAAATAIGVAAALVVPGAAGAQPIGAQPGGSVADLRGDVDRDSVIDEAGSSDEAGEDAWTRERGVVVLPNLDDDARRCPVRDSHGKPLPMKALVACHDAADTVVNGVRDADDLARLRTMRLPDVSAAASGTAALTGRGAKFGHLFVRRGTVWRLVKPTDTITADQLRGGVEFGLEATDVVRDPRRWDGLLSVRFTVRDGGQQSTDTVVARVAPLLTHHHLQRTERVAVSEVGRSDRDQTRFVAGLRAKVREAGVGAPLLTIKTDDRWAQDFFEPGYVSAPGPAGRAQTMRILIRSAQPSRKAGEQVWRRLRGPDVAAIQVTVKKSRWSTLDSMGNLETIPPYRNGARDYPAGRIVMGWWPEQRDKPAAAMRKLLAAQGFQQPLLLDTSWLAVGHVDEFLQFLPAPTPRGWRLAVSDPNAGLDVLRRLRAAGHGRTRVYSKPGRKTSRTTVDQALANRKLLADNVTAAAKIAANVALLKRETGLTDAEIVRIPGLYTRDDGAEPGAAVQMGAFYPGAINSVLLAPGRVLAARQWGPEVQGRDVFAEAVTAAYRSAGFRTDYLDDWTSYHLQAGEVHCGTNTLRSMATPWWGRAIG